MTGRWKIGRGDGLPKFYKKYLNIMLFGCFLTKLEYCLTFLGNRSMISM